MFDNLIPYLNHSLFPWAVSFLILLFALSLWVFFRVVRLSPIVKQLITAINIIEQHSSDSLINEFDQVDQAIQQLPVLAHPWMLFNYCITKNPLNQSSNDKDKPQKPPLQSNSQLAYHQAPIQFFNSQTLLAANINIRFYQSAPNLVIQLGLLFTFLGLLVALYAVGNGLVSTDLAQLRESLQILLTAATFKFITSLSGILASIIFSWREKYHYYQLIQLINHFNQLLENKMPPADPVNNQVSLTKTKASPEQKTRYTVSNTEIQQHNLHLEDIDNNLLVALNLGFNSVKKEIQRLNTGVSVATRRLYKAIHALGQDTDQPQKEQLETKSSASFSSPTKDEKQSD